VLYFPPGVRHKVVMPNSSTPAPTTPAPTTTAPTTPAELVEAIRAVGTPLEGWVEFRIDRQHHRQKRVVVRASGGGHRLFTGNGEEYRWRKTFGCWTLNGSSPGCGTLRFE
jgi:hypothetical protein